jgi:hypothetical protein
MSDGRAATVVNIRGDAYRLRERFQHPARKHRVREALRAGESRHGLTALSPGRHRLGPPLNLAEPPPTLVALLSRPPVRLRRSVPNAYRPSSG